MLDSQAVKGAYVYDYTITQGGITRHLRSVFALQSKEGMTSQFLVSLTAQCLESQHKDLAHALTAVTDSYKGGA